ncbi:hypothetical protein GE844_21985 [Salmonella enterica]|nr:hypothetical protein [Salmonella enterica]
MGKPAPSGAAPYSPAASSPGCHERRDGATGRRIRLRMLQAGFYASDRSVSPKPRQRVQRSLAGVPAGVS